MIQEPLDGHAARKLIQKILPELNGVRFCTHALDEMAKDCLEEVDVINVLRAGLITEPAEYKNGSWRYRVRARNVFVVVTFRSESQITVITTWRKFL